MATNKTRINDAASSPQTEKITNDIVIQKPYNNVTEPSDEKIENAADIAKKKLEELSR